MTPEQLLQKGGSIEIEVNGEREANEASYKPENALMKRMIVQGGVIFIVLTPEERLALHLRKKELGVEAAEFFARWLVNILNLDYPVNRIFNGSELLAYYGIQYGKLLYQKELLLYILQNIMDEEHSLVEIIPAEHRLVLEVMHHLREREEKGRPSSYRVLLENLYSFYSALAEQRQISPVSPHEFWRLWRNLTSKKLNGSYQGASPVLKDPMTLQALPGLHEKITK